MMVLQRFSMLLVTGALVELFLFVQVALWIGFLPMVLLAVATSLAGVMLMQLQGEAMRQQLSLALTRGELPAPVLVQGGMGWVGALLLTLPGFLTDALGLLCLIPGVRRRLARYFLSRPASPGGGSQGPRGPRVLEGDYTRERDDAP